jgi:hypothetical protein|tara:strand:+ start:127 stop:435 length:309 start_codon:yes stop_codon:yes gene_type:complete
MGRYAEKYREWVEILERWRASGLSGAEFCRREQLPAWQFYGWKRRVRDRQTEEGRFVELAFDGEARGCGVTVVVGGIRLELASGFDASELGRALKALSGLRC